jgi:hypothetical protein
MLIAAVTVCLQVPPLLDVIHVHMDGTLLSGSMQPGQG